MRRWSPPRQGCTTTSTTSQRRPQSSHPRRGRLRAQERSIRSSRFPSYTRGSTSSIPEEIRRCCCISPCYHFQIQIKTLLLSLILLFVSVTRLVSLRLLHGEIECLSFLHGVIVIVVSRMIRFNDIRSRRFQQVCLDWICTLKTSGRQLRWLRELE